MVEPWGDLGSGGTAVPALECWAVVPGGNEELVAAAMDALARRLGNKSQRQAKIGNGGAAVGDRPAGTIEFGESSLDPRAQLADGGGRLALGGAARKHDLDPVRGIDGHADPARALGAADPVGELVARVRGGDFLHAAKGYGGLKTCQRSQS